MNKSGNYGPVLGVAMGVGQIKSLPANKIESLLIHTCLMHVLLIVSTANFSVSLYSSPVGFTFEKEHFHSPCVSKGDPTDVTAECQLKRRTPLLSQFRRFLAAVYRFHQSPCEVTRCYLQWFHFINNIIQIKNDWHKLLFILTCFQKT